MPICHPQYTGYIQGLQETFKKTPMPSQLEAKDPEPDAFLYTRQSLPFKTSHASLMRDPCNDPDNFKKPEPDILWPRLLTAARQPSW